jgi:hypothetical protein
MDEDLVSTDDVLHALGSIRTEIIEDYPMDLRTRK